LLYLSLIGNSFWPIVIFQAVLTAVSVLFTAKLLSTKIYPGWLLVGALLLLSLLTPVGYFAGFAMPDIFAALAIIAGGNIAFGWHVQAKLLRLFWVVILTVSVLFHSATLLIIAGLTLILLVARLMRPKLRGMGRSWPLMLALAAGLFGEALFGYVVEHVTGWPPVRPPFVTARLIEDGPGQRYLNEHCDGPTRFLICRYRKRTPQPSDTFLWSHDQKAGMFMLLSPAQQRALSKEQASFALAVFNAYPLQTISASVRDIFRQMVSDGLSDFNVSPETRQQMASAIPPSVFAPLARTAAMEQRMPVRLVTFLALPLALLSLTCIALLLFRRDDGGRIDSDGVAKALASWIVAGFLLNAVVCGTISGPHDRYGSRVVWLLPLAAFAFAFRHPFPSRRGMASNRV
jgi:hypothetical protein